MHTHKLLTLFAVVALTACAGSQATETKTTPAPAPAPVPAAPQPVVEKESPPPTGPAHALHFPDVVRSETKSGLEINAVQMKKLPTIDLKLVIKSGSASDPEKMPGLAQLVASMLKEGTRKRSSAEIAEQVDFLGAHLWVDNDEENIYIQVRALSEHLDKAMDLIAELATLPAFSGAELAKLKKREMDRLSLREKDPNFLVAREFFHRLYGDHPYGHIDTTKEVVKKIRVADLKKFHREHFAPNNAFLVGVGDVTPEQLSEAAERAFKRWRKRKVAEPTYPELKPRDSRQVVIVDRPQSVQSVIFVGNLALARKDPNYIPLLLANQVLGGSAASRLFMDLREKQSLTYGAYSRVYESVDIAPFRAYAAVRNEVTDKAMAAFMKHLAQIGAEPAPPEELAAAKRFLVDQLPLRIDTTTKVANMVADLRTYGLPDDYWQSFRGQVEAVTAEQAKAAAEKYIQDDSALIVVVGQAAAIKDALSNYGPVLVIDAEGNVVTEATSAAVEAAPPTADKE